MTTQTQKIAWDIINCGLCNAPNTNSVCNPLYRSQSCSTLQDFQIPESLTSGLFLLKWKSFRQK